MVWVRLDDHFDQNPKIAQTGPLGIALWTVGLAYCNRNLTDGFIPWTSARSLLAWEYLEPPNEEGRRRVQSISVSCGMQGDDVTTDRVIDILVNAGLWEIDDARGGYIVHDYDHFQPLKEQVIEERRNSAERTARSRASRRNGASNDVGNTVTDGASNTVSTPAPVPVPVPVPVIPFPNQEGSNEPSAEETSAKRITGTFRQEMAFEFPDLNEPFEYEKATNHVAYRKAIDKRRYYRNWLVKARQYQSPFEVVPATDKFRDSRIAKQIAAAKERMG